MVISFTVISVASIAGTLQENVSMSVELQYCKSRIFRVVYIFA